MASESCRPCEKNWKRMESRSIKAERQRDPALDNVTRQRHKIYGLEMALGRGKGRELLEDLGANHGIIENFLHPFFKTRRKKSPTAVEKSRP